jgi:DNA polymerase III epsilon subunit-like protein
MIVFDAEMSGLDPEKHSIVSLGALDLDDPTNQFYEECRVWDGAHVEDEALAVNGFTHAEVTDPARQSEADLIKSFIAWALSETRPIANRTLAGQNVATDRAFVAAACARAGVECPFAHRTIDTHSIVWQHMRSRGLTPPVENGHSAINLTYALNYCGLPEEPKPHNALTGAYCHAEIVARVAYTKKLLPEFSAFELPWPTK